MAHLGFLCPTPAQQCFGALISDGLGGKSSGLRKYHHDNLVLLQCYGKYLVSQGYERRSRREYISPMDGRILMLSKKPGLKVMSGKSSEGARTKRAIGRPHQIVAH